MFPKLLCLWKVVQRLTFAKFCSNGHIWVLDLSHRELTTKLLLVLICAFVHWKLCQIWVSILMEAQYSWCFDFSLGPTVGIVRNLLNPLKQGFLNLLPKGLHLIYVHSQWSGTISKNKITINQLIDIKSLVIWPAVSP